MSSKQAKRDRAVEELAAGLELVQEAVRVALADKLALRLVCGEMLNVMSKIGLQGYDEAGRVMERAAEVLKGTKPKPKTEKDEADE